MNRFASRAAWLAAGLALWACALPACTTGDDEETGPQGDWPSYGHDGKNTRYNALETKITRENVADLRKEWDSSETGITSTAVTSTPAVVDGVVYFADWSGDLHAVDAIDGSEVWETHLPEEDSGLFVQVNASPFVTDDRVYIGGTQNRVYSVERETGKKVWDPHAMAGGESSVILWSSPNVVDDTLIIGIGSFEVFLPGPYTFKGNIVGLDADSGDEKWTTYVTEGNDMSAHGCSIWGSPAVDAERKIAYVGVGQAYDEPVSEYSDAVVAVNYETGALQWGHQFTENDIFTQINNPEGVDWDVGASVVLYEVDGVELVGAGDKGGNFYALSRDDGELEWMQSLTPGGKTGGVMASPAVADGVIYVYSNDGIDMNFGSGGPGSGSAFALDAANGDILWETEMTPGAFGGIAVANGLMFFTTLDGKIHALDIEDGEELWSDDLMDGSTGKAAGGVTVSGGMVFAGAGWDWIASEPAGGLTAYALP